MHGLFFRGLQSYVMRRKTAAAWGEVCTIIGVGDDQVDVLGQFDGGATHTLILACAGILKQPVPDMLQDFGQFLVNDPGMKSIRRLLRFSGTDFIDFLAALPDLDGRARLAVPDLIIPSVGMREVSDSEFELVCKNEWGFAHLVLGVLQALAEDYGALVQINLAEPSKDFATLCVQVIELNHTNGNDFSLVEVA